MALLSPVDDWRSKGYHSVIKDQCFASHLTDEDFIPFYYKNGGPKLSNRTLANQEASGKSILRNDQKKFKVALNVSPFEYKDISVAVDYNLLIINGKHQKKSDNYGFVEREFCRKYVLPDDVEIQKMYAVFYIRDKIVKITAPKIQLYNEERQIPIRIIY